MVEPVFHVRRQSSVRRLPLVFYVEPQKKCDWLERRRRPNLIKDCMYILENNIIIQIIRPIAKDGFSFAYTAPEPS